MGYFMADHRFHLIGIHVLQQTGAYRDQRTVPIHAGGECVGFRGLKYAHFRHAYTGQTRLFSHDVQQPTFSLVLCLFDNLYAHHLFCRPFGHG